jgi:hypothetical protein
MGLRDMEYQEDEFGIPDLVERPPGPVARSFTAIVR